ncbi:EAL domain-containing protein [Vibrio sp. 99-70-13A1]|uniref:EAL domain-containing protein n=1 Tax=Vibrio sp. 99-70-13A1 TaxID=2607601 RepID=UPI001493B907|nr:EAL domain-containing protein [Vibrio sp. 99-70-13A1]
MNDIILNKPHVLKNGRPTIAVLVGSMTSPYQEGIMRGAAYIATKMDYNIIGFCGGVINSDDHLTLARDKVFELVDMDLISGVISPFSSHTRFMDKQASADFINKFERVPVINIGSHIEGYTNVMTDYETGFSDLFEHFYHVHGYRKILLVRGPKQHASSEKRMDIYQSLLKKYDLEFDESMVVYSDLKRRSAKSKIEEYIECHGKKFDAVITINDNQALGIVDACLEQGIRVPEEVAVVGSMDTLEGAFTSPALTSIQEPLFELGRAAAIELIAQIEGKPARSEVKIPTSLITRESCGCRPSETSKLQSASLELDFKNLNADEDPIFKEAQQSFEKVIVQHKGGIIRDDVTSLLFSYQDAIYKQKYAAFLSKLKQQLEKELKSEDIMLWLGLASKLQICSLQYLETKESSASLVQFISDLTALKSEIEQLTIKFQSFETEYYLNYFRAIVNNLNSSFDLSTIKKYTVDILQLSELYISLFKNVNDENILAENIVSVRDNKFIELDNTIFNASDILPSGIEPYKDRYSLVVFPLSFANKPIGFMTVNLSNRKGTAFENLRAIISSALKNEMLIQDLKKAEERFSDIAHSTSNWLWETDVDNNFTYCSNSSTDIIGYAPEYLLGKGVNALNIDNGDFYINIMANHENLSDVECWYQHQNGNVICLLISAKPITKEGKFSGYRGIFEDITEQKLQDEKIRNLAYSDILTGLPNRTLFQDKLAETIEIFTKNDKKFALMFIDLDHFKNINDSMGHAAGDLLLIELAKRLSSSIRSRDILARLGGDEFVIIVSDISDEAEVIDIAQRIFNSFKEPINLYNKPVYVTLSLGISVFPNDGLDAEELLKKGDSAMYQAKSQGRNGYVFYDKVLEQKNHLRNIYEQVLRDAIANQGFMLNYQPQVSVRTQEVLGFEVLLRIIDPKLGVVAPNLFIPLAEELGLINILDEWVFEHACKQYAQWHQSGLGGVRLSINLSAVQLRDDAVLNKYIKIIEKHHVNPNDLQLEITENALIDNEEVALKILKGFKQYGVSIALDDFGTGYSSLSCINLYPIDTIKIDRSFVKDAVTNLRNKAIIQGTVLIANNLNLKIIAEGVETNEQCVFIKQLGCDEIQGFYYYKPCSALHAKALLEKQQSMVREIELGEKCLA